MRGILSSLVLTGMLLPASASFAQRSAGDLGLGLVVGEPTGLSAEYWTSSSQAVSGAVAWSIADKTRFHIHADWIFHDWDILQRNLDITEGHLPLYLGLGGRVRFEEDDSHVGVRFVVGVDYIFDEAPFDVFFEVAPIMDLIPETTVNGNAGLGIRVWF